MCSCQRFQIMHPYSFDRKILSSLLIWTSFIPLAILNGGFRDYILVELLPDKYVLAVSGIILSVLILFVTKILLSRIEKLSCTDCLVISCVWMLLTVLFELGMGLAAGSSVRELMEAYNPLSGNLWLLVVVTTGVAPFFALKLTRK